MKERVISGAIIGIILAVVFYFGGIVFEIFSLILAMLAYKELVDIKENEIPIGMKLIGLLLMVLLILANVSSHNLFLNLSYETLSFIFLTLLIPAIFIKKYSSNDAFYLSFAVIFISTIFNIFSNVYNDSIYLLIYIVLVAMSTDVFALFGGKLIGKHKLSKISPKKTVEGSVVGTIFATIIATTFYMVFIKDLSLIKVIPLTIFLSLIGQVGDIFFSLIKRENDKKDYSNLIPGHGGILDRLDSIIFVLITFTFIMNILIK